MFGFSGNQHSALNPDRISDADRMAKEVGINLSDRQFIELELSRWKKSPQRKAMLEGERYYQGEQDILTRKRTVIGKDGALSEEIPAAETKAAEPEEKKTKKG